MKRKRKSQKNESLDRYLDEIGKADPISQEEETKLVQKIRSGDRLALEKLTKAHLKFVVSIAKQYQNRELTLGDLINEGNVGLIKAAQRFDETRGVKFIAYAVWWIRQAIARALAEQSRIVKLPSGEADALDKISRTFSHLEQTYEREPSTDELAEALHMAEAEVANTLRSSGKHISMNAPLGSNDERSPINLMENEESEAADSDLLTGSLREELQHVLSTLTRRESDIITCCFGLFGRQAMTLDEVGANFGITRTRVKQIREKALRRLRHTVRSEALKHYLG